MESIYGNQREAMDRVLSQLLAAVEAYGREWEEAHGEKLFEHLSWRIKEEESMRRKLASRGLEATPYQALRGARDALGLRIVCLFIDDVYENAARLKALPGCEVVQEKDYIRDAKPNGYRSYHIILRVRTEEADVEGNAPGFFYVEVQLRTIAMDTWAALEHEMKYKREIASPELIAQELHRVANELASCDVSMQTLKHIIRGI